MGDETRLVFPMDVYNLIFLMKLYPSNYKNTITKQTKYSGKGNQSPHPVEPSTLKSFWHY